MRMCCGHVRVAHQSIESFLASTGVVLNKWMCVCISFHERTHSRSANSDKTLWQRCCSSVNFNVKKKLSIKSYFRAAGNNYLQLQYNLLELFPHWFSLSIAFSNLQINHLVFQTSMNHKKIYLSLSQFKMVLSDQQSKSQRYLIYKNITKKKAENPHIWEAGTRDYLTFFNWMKQSINQSGCGLFFWRSTNRFSSFTILLIYTILINLPVIFVDKLINLLIYRVSENSSVISFQH